MIVGLRTFAPSAPATRSARGPRRANPGCHEYRDAARAPRARALDRVLRAFLVGEDEQVVLGNQAIGQADLVQQKLQTGLEPDSLQLELDGVFGLEVEPLERGQVENDGPSQVVAQSLGQVVQGRGPAEAEVIGLEKRILDRAGLDQPRQFGDSAGNRLGPLGRRFALALNPPKDRWPTATRPTITPATTNSGIRRLMRPTPSKAPSNRNGRGTSQFRKTMPHYNTPA